MARSPRSLTPFVRPEGPSTRVRYRGEGGYAQALESPPPAWVRRHRLHASRRGARRGRVQALQADALEKRLQDLRVRNGRPARRHGQRGRLVPEVCKKSIQAQAGDMQAPIGEAFFREHSIAELESWSSLQMEAAGRLAFPIAWQRGRHALPPHRMGRGARPRRRDLNAAPREATFFYSSGRSSNEAAFLMQTLARAYGTANIHNCSFYCHQASAWRSRASSGAGRRRSCSTISTRPISRSSRARTRRRTTRG